MSDDKSKRLNRRDNVIAVSLAIAIVTAMGGVFACVAYAFNGRACSAAWDASGMKHRYDYMAGCLVETSPGRWIPANSYRQVAP